MENRVLRRYYRTKWDRDREGKGEWSVELARAKECKRCQETFRPHKLLQEIYQRFCLSSQADEYAHQKGCEVGMGEKPTEGI